MALLSRCSKCDGTSWEAVEREPRNSNYKQIFVQCRSCGTPIGVTDFYNVGSLVKQQEKKIEEMSRKLDRLGHVLDQITHALRR